MYQRGFKRMNFRKLIKNNVLFKFWINFYTSHPLKKKFHFFTKYEISSN